MYVFVRTPVIGNFINYEVSAILFMFVIILTRLIGTLIFCNEGLIRWSLYFPYAPAESTVILSLVMRLPRPVQFEICNIDLFFGTKMLMVYDQ